MTKEQAIEKWMARDDADCAREVGVSRQAIRHWRTNGAGKSKYEAQILDWCEKHIKDRPLEKRLVPVRLGQN